MGSNPGWEAKIPHASWPKAKENKKHIKQKGYCTKFSKDLKDGPYQKSFKNSMKYWISLGKKTICYLYVLICAIKKKLMDTFIWEVWCEPFWLWFFKISIPTHASQWWWSSLLPLWPCSLMEGRTVEEKAKAKENEKAKRKCTELQGCMLLAYLPCIIHDQL